MVIIRTNIPKCLIQASLLIVSKGKFSKISKVEMAFSENHESLMTPMMIIILIIINKYIYIFYIIVDSKHAST